MANVLIGLGAVAALAGLAWLAYAGSVMKGRKGNALAGGISATVIGGALFVLGATVSDETEQVQQFVSGFPTATPAPNVTPTPTLEPDPSEIYREAASALAVRASSDLSRITQLLQNPNDTNQIWLSDVRQTSSQFARYEVRASELAAPPGWADVQERLTQVLADLARAGRLVNESLDAVQRQNVAVAQSALTEALGMIATASGDLADITSEVAG